LDWAVENLFKRELNPMQHKGNGTDADEVPSSEANTASALGRWWVRLFAEWRAM